MYDVFISFSTRDLAIAEKTVGVLTEKYGLSCWIYTEKKRRRRPI